MREFAKNDGHRENIEHFAGGQARVSGADVL